MQTVTHGQAISGSEMPPSELTIPHSPIGQLFIDRQLYQGDEFYQASTLEQQEQVPERVSPQGLQEGGEVCNQVLLCY